MIVHCGTPRGRDYEWLARVFMEEAPMVERLRMLTIRGRLERLAAGQITDTNGAIKEIAGAMVEMMATPYEDAVEAYQRHGGESAKAQFDAEVEKQRQINEAKLGPGADPLTGEEKGEAARIGREAAERDKAGGE